MDGLTGPPNLVPAIKVIETLRKAGVYKGAGLLRTWLADGSSTKPVGGVEEGSDPHRCFRCNGHLTERQDCSGYERKLLLWGRNEYGQDHPCMMILYK
eukprot:4428602-Pyramimonas_sp.AAC.1